jgi:hypothetical protein
MVEPLSPHSPQSPTSRRDWPIRVYHLGEEPSDDLSACTSPEQRIEMVWELTRRMWTLSGRPWPDYPRAAMPGRVIRPA